jgi:hypothetical protein
MRAATIPGDWSLSCLSPPPVPSLRINVINVAREPEGVPAKRVIGFDTHPTNLPSLGMCRPETIV